MVLALLATPIKKESRPHYITDALTGANQSEKLFIYS
jgi:hypothetical protein